jgi:hypothetical protein
MSEYNGQTNGAINSLNGFEQFMSMQAHGWVLVNKTDRLLSYQKITPAKKASCLILIILLFLFVVPALLYLYFGHKSGKTYQLSVTINEAGTLQATGDPEGMKLFSKYLGLLKEKQRTESVTKV